jgi:hypothetical protein
MSSTAARENHPRIHRNKTVRDGLISWIISPPADTSRSTKSHEETWVLDRKDQAARFRFVSLNTSRISHAGMDQV